MEAVHVELAHKGLEVLVLEPPAEDFAREAFGVGYCPNELDPVESQGEEQKDVRLPGKSARAGRVGVTKDKWAASFGIDWTLGGLSGQRVEDIIK